MKLTFIFSILATFFLISSCFKGKSVDTIVHNARIHTMDDQLTVGQAMAVKDGLIVEIGPERQILNKYSANETIDAGGKDVYPGFTDAHGHMLLLAKQRLSADLTGSRSFDEVLTRVEKYQQKKHRSFIVGRGWDQSLWNNTDLPDNKRLNELFPDTPVCLYRIDVHALLANDAALKLANITSSTTIDGGIIHQKDGLCTGLLVDNAMEAITKLIPPFSNKDIQQTLLEIQEDLFQYGITGVHEAGIDFKDIALFEELINNGKLHLNTYAMLMPTPENFNFARKNGIYENKNLLIRSFKVFGDGALGSRGAYLKEEYHDAPNHFGLLTTPIKEMQKIADFCNEQGYQMNTHSIGDSTNRILLDIYAKEYEKNKDHRWRIEHAQLIDPIDLMLFGKTGAFPSVQPTHAVSDQRWIEDRVGQVRMQGAYAYKTLMTKAGMLAIGTDFPVEDIDPFLTIHAAVQRKNSANFPTNGFLMNEAITLNQCIKGMTIWAAFATFQENQLGSLEKGKDATFVIFESTVVSQPLFVPNFAHSTFIKGKKVYSVE
jgi:predicted amidohydrolase YtcJ